MGLSDHTSFYEKHFSVGRAKEGDREEYRESVRERKGKRERDRE